MARKTWSSLSDGYRNRLERNGVTREQYESGASLEKARGHGATPEHPERAESNKEKYKDYLGNRDRLITKIQQIKRELFGDRSKWNARNSRRNIAVEASTGKIRSISDLVKILDMAQEAQQEAQGRDEFFEAWDNIFADEEPNDREAFFYH